jgi:hypothetical protein
MKQSPKEFALCLDNKDYEGSLIVGKIYRVLPDSDPRPSEDGLIRIIDESGEDYLYDRSHFVFVDFPPAIKKKIRAIQNAT